MKGRLSEESIEQKKNINGCKRVSMCWKALDESEKESKCSAPPHDRQTDRQTEGMNESSVVC